LRITSEMIDWGIYSHIASDQPQDRSLEFLQSEIQRYMEYPVEGSKRRFVWMYHDRGKSRHVDFRFEVNDHLNGWTIFLGNIEMEFPYSAFMKEAKKFRGETKGRQPKDWLFQNVGVGEKREIKPGDPGATRGEIGIFTILERGHFWEGAQKPYFHEYFLKDEQHFKDWLRIVVRGIKAKRIDPETKKPMKAMELIWTIWAPLDQTPYVLTKRAAQEGWYPPKGRIPIPPEWRTGKYKKEFEEWQSRHNQFWSEHPEGFEGLSRIVRFTLHENSYQGQKVVRGLPNLEWYLRLDDGRDKVRSWQLEGNPLFEGPLMAISEGRISKKWMTFEGKIRPGQQYNPTKKLIANMSILDRGSASASITYNEREAEQIALKFRGHELKGDWVLNQEEKDSDVYTFSSEARLAELEVVSLYKGNFVYDHHFWNGKEHWDLRIDAPPIFEEFSLYGKLHILDVDQPVFAFRKRMWDKSWMETKPLGTVRMVGPLKTNVETLDHGKVRVIDNTPLSTSMFLEGKLLKGYYVATKEESGWVARKSKLPGAHELMKQVWQTEKVRNEPDFFRIAIWDIKDFVRCEPDFKKYLPELKLEAGIVDVSVCLYQVPGTIHHAKVQSVTFDKNDWTEDSAKAWAKNKNLQNWDAEQIKGGKEKD